MDKTPTTIRLNARTSPARPQVKICGLSDEATIDLAIGCGADEIGLVHFAPSPRHLGVGRIGELARHVADRAAVTIVTVDPDDALLDDIMLRAGGHLARGTIQLHGSEDPARVLQVKARTGLAAMKAIAVADESFARSMLRYMQVADRILLDAKAPKASRLPGGNGVSFDWRLLDGAERVGEIGIVLSGGLNPGNVGEAIRIARPAGIDVSSGVEDRPGVKSADLLHRFFGALDAATLSNAGRQTP